MHLLAAQIVRTSMASVSFTASTTIIIMISRADNGLRTPYSRIIFGLSIADIMKTIGIIISPLVAPRDTLDAPWAMGSTESCAGIGLVLYIGQVAAPFYILFLTHYFIQRVKHKVTPAQFARKKERWVTAFIWSFPFIGGLVGLANGYFNPGKNGSLCFMVEKPLHCAADPDTFGACIRGRDAAIANFFLGILPLIFMFAMLVITLVRFTVHVYWQENMFKPSQELINQGYWERLKAATIGTIDTATGGRGGQETVVDTHAIRNTSPFDTTTSGQEHAVDESASDVEMVQEVKTSSSLAMQSFVQSVLYISAFSLCFIAPGTIIVMGALRIPPPDWLFWMTSTVWPLGGFFNILIYTRPKVIKYQKTNPQYSRPYIFLVVVLSGGEVPTEIDFGDSDNDFEDKADILKHIMRNILDYRSNRAKEEEMYSSERKPELVSSNPSAGVFAKSQDSFYLAAMQNNSFSENPSTHRSGVDEHTYSNIRIDVHSSSCQSQDSDYLAAVQNNSFSGNPSTHRSRVDEHTYSPRCARIAWVNRDGIESKMSCMTGSLESRGYIKYIHDSEDNSSEGKQAAVPMKKSKK